MSLRPAGAADAGFLLEVFASTRDAELEALGWPDDRATEFVRMQFDARNRHYRSAYPSARDYVVEYGGIRVGRLVVDRRAEEFLIVDLAVLPGWRRMGVGRAAVETQVAEARRSLTPMRCSVLLDNPARAFWEDAGFVVTGREGAHLRMERTWTE